VESGEETGEREREREREREKLINYDPQVCGRAERAISSRFAPWYEFYFFIRLASMSAIVDEDERRNRSFGKFNVTYLRGKFYRTSIAERHTISRTIPSIAHF